MAIFVLWLPNLSPEKGVKEQFNKPYKMKNLLKNEIQAVFVEFISDVVDWRLPVSNQFLQNLIRFLDFKVW